ncbi:MAG: molybdate ABC transporter substrate-binding protein [Propionibacteriaceae bacterium]|jgi:molybdate transport system substrate-binding protein|nr:molybdate ABC transporter substrate-binding protein [Propionibacteriaceae bacterium]
MKLFPAAIAVLAGATILAGCATSGQAAQPPSADGTSPQASSQTSQEPQTLTVLAAASLTETFTKLGKQFEAANPGVTVALSFDGSSTLVQQIEQGAPADVFASADQANMDKLSQAGYVDGTPTTFAQNSLVIAVPKGNPAQIGGLTDLADSKAKVVLCDAEVPCGAVAQRVLAAADVAVKPVSLEQNVKAVVTKVAAGEADAGLVYATDVKAAGDAVEAVALPDDEAVAKAAVTQYPITVVKGSAHTALASDFIDYVLSDDGQRVLADAGFQSAG